MGQDRRQALGGGQGGTRRHLLLSEGRGDKGGVLGADLFTSKVRQEPWARESMLKSSAVRQLLARQLWAHYDQNRGHQCSERQSPRRQNGLS